MKISEGPIGIIDSGLGGITVLAEVLQRLPHEKYIYYGDSLHAPYGNKQKDIVVNLTSTICDCLYEMSCKAIVVACNTATSLVIDELRKKYSIPIVGMEPAVKPVSGKNKDIVVMATPNTLKEKKFLDLVAELNIDDKVIKLPALGLVDIVENQWYSREVARLFISNYFSQINMSNVGSIVLGCTHFVFFRRIIEEIVGRGIEIIDGNAGTISHLIRLLEQNDLINTKLQKSEVIFLNSDASKIPLGKKLLLHLQN